MTRGPDWLGIGAQRSGTTWFTDLLVQHPQVQVPSVKEQHVLYEGLVRRWPNSTWSRYVKLHNDAHSEDPGSPVVGEFTPYYLRALWVPAVVRDHIDEEAPLFVLLRDPVARFASAIRHEMARTRAKSFRLGGKFHRLWLRRIASDAQWAGMYATQLEVWRNQVGPDRLHVIQYEKFKADPQATLDDAWRSLHLEPVHLIEPNRPSATVTEKDVWQVEEVPGLYDALVQAYRPEAARLTRWGIDLDLWPSLL